MCFILGVFLLLTSTKFALIQCGGTLQFRLEAFDNFHSTLVTGECCQPTKQHATCLASCNTFFQVCVSDQLVDSRSSSSSSRRRSSSRRNSGVANTTPAPPKGVRISRIASRRRRVRRQLSTAEQTRSPEEVEQQQQSGSDALQTRGTLLQVVPINNNSTVGTNIKVIHRLIHSGAGAKVDTHDHEQPDLGKLTLMLHANITESNGTAGSASSNAENLAAYFFDKGDYVNLFFAPAGAQNSDSLRSLSRRDTNARYGGWKRQERTQSDAFGALRYDDCKYGYVASPIVDGDALNSSPLSVSFEFSGAWIGDYTLVVEAWHSRNQTQADVDLNETEAAPNSSSLIKRFVIPRRDVITDVWSRDIVTDKSHQLEYSVRVVCAANTNDGCLTDCEAAAVQAASGHYRCLSDGLIECVRGWTGDKCDVPICTQGCHPLYGYCVRPDECLCKIGYGGPLCDSCTPLPGCLHGSCDKSFECNCEPGWTGLFCNKPTCADGCDSSRGYCSLPDECTCRVGWTGQNCSQCQLLPGCVRGHCREPLECRCHPGWTGFFCERAICSEGCSREHGYCEKPGVCRCELGWHGDRCDQCFPYPGCVHGTCSQPWQCNCHTDWTGFLCDKRVDPCGHNASQCLNGATCHNTLVDGEPAASCHCTVGFHGDHCQLPVAAAATAGDTAAVVFVDQSSPPTATVSLTPTSTQADDLAESGTSLGPSADDAARAGGAGQQEEEEESVTQAESAVSDSDVASSDEATATAESVTVTVTVASEGNSSVRARVPDHHQQQQQQYNRSEAEDTLPASDAVLPVDSRLADTLSADEDFDGSGAGSDLAQSGPQANTTRAERKVDHQDSGSIPEAGVNEVTPDEAGEVDSSLADTQEQAQVIADNIRFVISSFKRMAKNLFRPGTPPQTVPNTNRLSQSELKKWRRPVSNLRPATRYHSYDQYLTSSRYKTYPVNGVASRRQDVIHPRSQTGGLLFK